MSFVGLFDRIIAAASSDAALLESLRSADEAAAPTSGAARYPAVPRRGELDMYDPDEAMARESAQQGLVDEIVRDLNAHFGATRDVAVRLRTLQALLAMAHGLDPEPSAGLEFLRRQVAWRVERFAASGAEACVLMVRVAQKVFGSLSADAEGGLLRETLGLR